MTEIEEVAQAIYEKHVKLWPLTSEMAAYIAMKEAGDQGVPVVNSLTQALEELNQSPPSTKKPG